jgi:hypothetical protein
MQEIGDHENQCLRTWFPTRFLLEPNRLNVAMWRAKSLAAISATQIWWQPAAEQYAKWAREFVLLVGRKCTIRMVGNGPF